ncbi:MAG: aminoglycoside phosphotransferase family protein [Nostoc sp.]|uniref:aminoglycoside phosphotransferase family protein n=1 Tax=Nostoc sp. TaxID=1180 RepID=UPI002FF7BE2B
MTIHLNYQNLFIYLINAGICKKDDLDSLKFDFNHSKSFYWVIIPHKQDKLFVKQIPQYRSLYNDVRIYKEWHFYNFLQSHKDLDYVLSLIPEVLHFDDSNSILIYKCPNNYITLKSYYENQETFPNAIAELVGTTLAKLHSQTISSQECYTFLTELEEHKLNYQLPYPDYLSDYLLSRTEPESLKKSQAVSWRFLGIFQQTEAVREVVTELVLNHRHFCLTHNNIHFDKILIPKHWEKLVTETQDSDKSLIKLIDWEACSWGDPACDLGKAILGYFLLWIDSMIVHPAIEVKKSIQLATIPLEVFRPSIVAMTKAYINTYPKVLEDYPEFLKRVIQFAGLGLIYQLLAEFQLQPEIALSHQELYFFIAGQLLCKPEKFLSI